MDNTSKVKALLEYLELAENALDIHKKEASTMLIRPLIDMLHTHAKAGLEFYKQQKHDKGNIALIKLYMALEHLRDLSMITGKLFEMAEDSEEFKPIRKFIDKNLSKKGKESKVFRIFGSVITFCKKATIKGDIDVITNMYLSYLKSVAERNVKEDFDSTERSTEIMCALICEYFHHDNFPEHYVKFQENLPFKGTEVVCEFSEYYDKHGEEGFL